MKPEETESLENFSVSTSLPVCFEITTHLPVCFNITIFWCKNDFGIQYNQTALGFATRYGHAELCELILDIAPDEASNKVGLFFPSYGS